MQLSTCSQLLYVVWCRWSSNVYKQSTAGATNSVGSLGKEQAPHDHCLSLSTLVSTNRRYYRPPEDSRLDYVISRFLSNNRFFNYIPLIYEKVNKHTCLPRYAL